MAKAVGAVEMQPEAWIAEQCKFRELAASVRTLSQTVECRASGLVNVLEALRSASEAAPRLPPRSVGVSSLSTGLIVRSQTDATPISPKCESPVVLSHSN